MIRLIHKAAARLRHEGYLPEHMTISVTFVGSPARKGWGRGASWSERAALGWSDDTPTMVKMFAEMWERMPDQTPMAVGVTLHDLVKRGDGDSALFTGQKRSRKLSEAMDKLGRKYGPDVVYSAAMHEAKTSAPSRIAFSNIPDMEVPDVIDDE
jgi:DNA polymerase-4